MALVEEVGLKGLYGWFQKLTKRLGILMHSLFRVIGLKTLRILSLLDFRVISKKGMILLVGNILWEVLLWQLKRN